MWLAEKTYILSPDKTVALIREEKRGDQEKPSSLSEESFFGVYDAITAQKKFLVRVLGKVHSGWISENNLRAVIRTTNGKITVLDLSSGSALGEYLLPVGRAAFTLSPKGNYLASYKPSTIGEPVRIYNLIDLRTGTKSTAKENVPFWDFVAEDEPIFQFSPDESALFYLSDKTGFLGPTRVRLPVKAKTFVGESLITKRYTAPTFLALSSEKILFVGNRTHPLEWGLYEYDLSSRKVSFIASRLSYGEALKKHGNLVSFASMTPSGADLMVYDTRSKKVLSLPLTPPDGDAFMKKPARINLTNGGQALLFLPDGEASTSTPLLVWLHGGPYRQISEGYHPFSSYGQFNWILEEARKSGVAILYIDYRGSYGYGRAYAGSLVRQVGRGDVGDVLEAISAAKKKVVVDRTFLMGVSYGGYLALRTAAQNPSAFSGIISINSVTDWKSLVDSYHDSIFRIHFDGIPSRKNMALYEQASILKRITLFDGKKILLFHGNADKSVPYSQSTLLKNALDEANIQAEFITYDDEDHVYEKPENIQDLCRRTLLFVGSKNGENACTLTTRQENQEVL